ncbi:Histone-fold,TATA box binding protein associated factor (TAF),Armadillo-like helical,TAF6, C-terminal HEAT [Cinara cedri]|uniref:Transcription initiation factor TFIID subunit 6 n=1 Tax=Cinara cedri TaxID=506608 RepID=A0A5E4NJY1_9HEMI|nr:Histone-fold,TATA box binding protein associated factor (TAF),Armadillo-like helical,TAF6, C-terminal HEAT [Cinara cedri]
MNTIELNYGSTIPIESIKVIAESIGISALSDESAKELSDSATYRLKLVLQESKKFMMHSKRCKLLISDIDNALKAFGIEPVFGFHSKQHLPFKYASGGGRELHYTDDKDIDLIEFVNKPLAKLPLDISIHCHWLAIDGIQPNIPENPSPISRDIQKQECVNPIVNLKKPTITKEIPKRSIIVNPQKWSSTETVYVKELATHELSVEQQLYYKEITEACVGSDETRRAEALQSLATDPGLYDMLPRLSSFIAEGVKINVAQSNLALLIYLMRMVKALLENSALYLEKYLHEIIPSVSTCIVSKQLCMRPEIDNHWALRDFASRLMAQICKMFTTSTNQIQTRITRVFTSAIYSDDTPLSSIYGAIEGLSELGIEPIKLFVIPSVRVISEKLDSPELSQNNIDRISINQIKNLLCKVLIPALKTTHQLPENVEEYKKEFGSIGVTLFAAVWKARPSSSSNQTVTQTSTQSETVIGRPVGASLNNSGISQKYILMSQLKYQTSK